MEDDVSSRESSEVSFQRSPSLHWSHRFPPSSCGGCSASGRPSSAPPSAPPLHCHCCCCQGSPRSGRFWAAKDKRCKVKNRSQTTLETDFVGACRCVRAIKDKANDICIPLKEKENVLACYDVCVYSQFVQFLVHFWINEYLCLVR